MFAAFLCRLGLLSLAVACLSGTAGGELIPARYKQGTTHGFAVLKTLDGKTIANGEFTQLVFGDRVRSRLVFRFRDGSIDDEETVFDQRKFIRLISEHHIQRGPSFPEQIDVSINVANGEVTSLTPDGTATSEHINLPEDLSNGLPPNQLLDIQPATPETKVSYLATGKKSRLVQLSMKATGKRPFSAGGLRRTAIDYTIHVDIGGVAGIVAPLIGKQPSDYHVFIESGQTPAFLGETGAFYPGGPIWRIELVSPNFGPDLRR